MKDNNICFVAQFPPPIHGLSKAVDTLYKSKLSVKYGFINIDIKNNKAIIQTILKILTVDTDVFYFTISQTRWGNLRDLLFVILFKLRHKKCIIHLHGGYFRNLIDKDCNIIQRKINYLLFKHIDRVIVLSNSLTKIFDGLINLDRISVVENCVDNDYLPKTIKDNDNHKTTLNILYLSNFIKEKGYRDVLEIAHILKRKGLEKNFRFEFAGKFFDTSEEDFFFNYIKTNNLKSIKYHGVVLGKNKQELLSNSDIFILLTRYPKEGQPISIIEAMANGMAIVTTNHAGIPDMVKNYINGIVCDANQLNLEDIVDYLLHCYSNRDYLNAVGANNRKTVFKKYTENKYIEKMDKIFSEVLYEK